MVVPYFDACTAINEMEKKNVKRKKHKYLVSHLVAISHTQTQTQTNIHMSFNLKFIRAVYKLCGCRNADKSSRNGLIKK